MRRVLTLLALASLACEPPPADVLATRLPIVDGRRELGEPAVVWISVFGSLGGLCTGTLITPSVVLTAKHCVQGSGASAPYPPAAFTVGIGDRVGEGTMHRVRYVETTPGVYTSDNQFGLRGAIFGVDVAVLVLREPVTDVEPIPIRRDRPDDMIGQTFTAVGFGRRPEGGSGEKYKGDGVLDAIDDGILYTREVICSGDSGGPMIQETPERRVIGVASFGQAGSCPSSRDGYNAIYEHTDLIDRARIVAGECLGGEEVCNSLDDDCDGETDEGCAPLGAECTADTDCAYAQLPAFLPPLAAPAVCEVFDGRSICTRACDPTRPHSSCGDGDAAGDAGALYCRRTSACEGRCLPGVPGLRADGESCTADTDCASLSCGDPGAGGRRCLPVCKSGEGTCPIGEACTAALDACGYCVDAGLVRGARQLGEPCVTAADCAGDSECVEDPAGGYCTHACESDLACPSGFRCAEGRCLRGGRARTGEPCRDNSDCVPGEFCADQAGRKWCTRFCTGESCGDGLDCVAAGEARVCAPARSLLGEACDRDDECLDGLCEAGVCTRACGADSSCPTGFVCRRDSAGNARCLSPEASGGGCSAAPGRRAPLAFVLAITGLALLLRRRALA